MEEKPFTLTPDQKKAVDAAGGSVSVVAGAGTGKTCVLVERYIRLLREGEAGVSNIIAITFTEKAAKEMKDRIRAACLKELHQARAPEERQRWIQHRNDLDHARVGTIHSLCAQIIRECPVEAGVDPRFSVLDEVEADILLDKTSKETLTGLIKSDDADAVALVAEYDFAKSLQLINEIVERRDLLKTCVDGWDLADEEKALARWKKAVLIAQREAASRLMADPRWKEDVATLRQTRPLSEADKIAAQRTELLRLLSRIDQGISEATLPLFSSMRDQFDGRGGKKTAWAEGDLKLVKDTFVSMRAALDENAVFQAPGLGENERRAIGLTRALVGVSRHIIEAYGQRKQDSAFLDFNDLELIARDLLVNNPTAQERYRSRIKHALVDEFQDTNEIQKEILCALTGGAATDRLFIVGDAKQSIYRFRRAEVSVFNKTHAEVGKAKGECVDLQKNFRSLPGLVGFANHFFGRIMGRVSGEGGEPSPPRADYEAPYSELTAKREAPPARPLVEFLLPQRKAEDAADDARRREAETIANRILRMVDGEERLVNWPKEDGRPAETPRPVRFKHIAVLFRAMPSLWIYERAFRERGIPYYVVAGSGFYARQEIRDMLNLVRVLDNRMDDLSLAGVLRSPMFAVNDNTLFLLGFDRKTPLFERLLAHASVREIVPKEREKLAHASAVLQDLLGVRDRISLPELLGRALDATRYDAVLLSQFLGRQKALNVYKLVEVARRFDRRGIFTLHDFADYVSQFVASDVREGEAPLSEEADDVVKMMTIHKAKGLEFPVVFVADISRGEQHQGKDLYFDPDWGLALTIRDEEGRGLKTLPVEIMAAAEKRKEEAESKRVLYVAATRAQDYLVFSGWSPAAEQENGGKGREKPGPWYSWLDVVFNISDAADGKEIAGDGWRVRVTRDVPDAKGAVHGIHKSWAERCEKEIAEGRPLPERPVAGSEGIERRISEVGRLLAAKQRFTPSELLEYHWCPRLYELHRVLGLPPRDVRKGGGLGPRDHARLRGRLAHRALEMAVRADKTPLDGLLGAVLSEELAADLAAFRDSLDEGTLLREVRAMVARFRNSEIFQQIRRRQEPRCELAFLAPFNPRTGGRDFYLEGKIDLLYLGPDGWEVLDYKTGSVGHGLDDGDDDGAALQIAPKSSGAALERIVQAAHEIQLGAYCLAAEKLLGARPSGAALFFLSSEDAPRRRPVTLEYMTESYNRLLGLVESIRACRFEPAHPEVCPCDYAWACPERR